VKSFTEWCQHYEYDPISPKVRADYQRYREQLELFQALPEEQSECSACGLLTATSSVVGENRSTVMRERYEQDDEGGWCELGPTACDVVTETVVLYRCSSCGHERIEPL
jgi:hypothetical protein